VGAPRDRARLSQGRRHRHRGKLKAAARAWATGGAPDLSEAAQDALAFGSPELAAAIGDTGGERGFRVYRRNWDTLLAFLCVSTQWRAVGHGMGAVYWMGLDYSAAKVGLELSGIEITPALWAGLQTMERAARDALNGIRG